ncbi:hypothetical protein [Glaesserella sp.]|uniref:hypothetical protein n=1 Tax=Glaesserella sp. TaxID=2094731 RepID=UPI00359FAAC3
MFNGWELIAQQDGYFKHDLRTNEKTWTEETHYAVSQPNGQVLALFNPQGKPKSLAYNYSPFYKELSGSSLDILKSGLPKKLDNNYIYFGDKFIQKIERYGKTGKLAGIDYIIEKKDKRKIISVDNFNDIEKYIKVLFNNGVPTESYKIDDCENGSATIYIYNKEKISKSLSFSMIDGLSIKNETIYNYDKDGVLDNILSIVNGHQGIIYQK